MERVGDRGRLPRGAGGPLTVRLQPACGPSEPARARLLRVDPSRKAERAHPAPPRGHRAGALVADTLEGLVKRACRRAAAQEDTERLNNLRRPFGDRGEGIFWTHAHALADEDGRLAVTVGVYGHLHGNYYSTKLPITIGPIMSENRSICGRVLDLSN